VALVQALQESVPSYIVDAARQAACIASLQAIVGTLGRSSAPEIPRVVAVRTDPDVRVVTDSVKSHARQLGLPLLDQTKLMTAAAELARNILQYAGKGEVRFRPVDPPRKGLVIEAEDRGPGIPDVNRVLSPDYVSKTGMGIGLQGTKRLVDEFEIRSGPGLGTTVTLRKYA
jgi:serine/threonine-protein kinase RsbT